MSSPACPKRFDAQLADCGTRRGEDGADMVADKNKTAGS